jgi:hypothetical protein
MSKKLEGQVAVVTGASKGIGAAVAEHLAGAGAAVVVNYASSKTGAEAVVNRIRQAGGKAVAVQADVSKPEDVRRLFEIKVTGHVRAGHSGEDFACGTLARRLPRAHQEGPWPLGAYPDPARGIARRLLRNRQPLGKPSVPAIQPRTGAN